MDGTSRQVLHSTGLVWPNALTLDYDNQILYWMDANRLESSNADGSNRRFLSTTRIFHPFGITFFQNRLYWTDWTLNSVLSAPVNRPTAVSVVISNLRLDPMGISVVSVERQPAGLLLWYPDRIMMVSTYIILCMCMCTEMKSDVYVCKLYLCNLASNLYFIMYSSLQSMSTKQWRLQSHVLTEYCTWRSHMCLSWWLWFPVGSKWKRLHKYVSWLCVN